MESELHQARRLFRNHRVGRLVATLPDGIETRAEDCHFIVDGSTGKLVFAVTSAMLDLDEPVICIPDECSVHSEDSLELWVHLSHEPMVSEELRDRLIAYHGHIRGGVWVWARIQSVRFADEVFDGEVFELPNGLLHDEWELCRRCNASPDRLAQAAHARFGVTGSRVCAVGVDGFGIDLRVGHGIVRVEFSSEVSCAQEAAEEIDLFLSQGERL